MNVEREESERQKTLQRERRRQESKEVKREALLSSPSYWMMDKTAKYMDRYFLDAIIGFFVPGIGDVLTGGLALPFIYFSLFRVRSIPLTLAVIHNTLKDVLLGLIPFYIGDIIDVFHRSYVTNLELITGYVNDDRDVIDEVNRTAFWSAIVIVILCVIIYYMVKWTIALGKWVAGYLHEAWLWLSETFDGVAPYLQDAWDWLSQLIGSLV